MPKAWEGEVGLSTLCCLQCSDDLSPYTIDIGQHLLVPEPNDPPAQFLQISCPPCILVAFGVVLTAVELDDELSFDTSEIGEIRSYRMLSPELDADRAGSQQAPELPLNVRRVAT